MEIAPDTWYTLHINITQPVVITLFSIRKADNTEGGGGYWQQLEQPQESQDNAEAGQGDGQGRGPGMLGILH